VNADFSERSLSQIDLKIITQKPKLKLTNKKRRLGEMLSQNLASNLETSKETGLTDIIEIDHDRMRELNKKRDCKAFRKATHLAEEIPNIQKECIKTSAEITETEIIHITDFK
jgi:hypothetical protein